MSNQKNAPGGVDQLTSGHWRVRISFPGGNRRSTTFPTHDEAERFRRGTVGLRSNWGDVRTLLAWGEQWLERRELAGLRNVKPTRSIWKNHVATAPFAEDPLVSITRRDVKAWIAALQRKRALDRTAWKPGSEGHRTSERFLSRQIIVHAVNLLRKCLDDAVEDGLLTANPVKGLRVSPAPSTEDPWTFLSVEEIETVVTSHKIPEPERLLFTVAIYTGLRQGELWGLRWDDVTLEANHPKLVVRYSHRGPTKSGKIRHVPLLLPARMALLRWRAQCPPTAEGLVFPTTTGCRRPKSNDARWGDRVREKGTIRNGWKTVAGITRRVRFHDLRHTTASHLVMGSWGLAWSLAEVCEYLGHSDISVTQRYAHLSPEHLHRKASETARAGHAPGHAALGVAPKSPVLSKARDTRFELVTFGSGGQHEVPVVSNGYSAHDQRVTSELLSLVAQGSEVPEALLVQLAGLVLDQELVDLALQVREPGPHRLRRALELAVALCAQASARHSKAE